MRLSRDPNFFFRAGEQPHLVMPTGVRICVPNLKRLLLLAAAAIRFLDFECFDANRFFDIARKAIMEIGTIITRSFFSDSMPLNFYDIFYHDES